MQCLPLCLNKIDVDKRPLKKRDTKNLTQSKKDGSSV